MSTTHGEAVLYVKRDGVAWVTLNRPEARNRINLRTCAGIRRACEAIAQDDDVRLAVITGAGDSFCDGDDELPSLSSEGTSPQEAAGLP